MLLPQPTIHKPFEMNKRVRARLDNKCFIGEIIGVSSVHIFWTYIVLLDEPYNQPGVGMVRAISVPGQALEEI